MLLNHYYDVLYDWQPKIQSLGDRGLLVERISSDDKFRSDNRSSNDKSDRSGKSRQLDGYHSCTYCGRNHNPSVCQLIDHSQSNKNGEWVNSASYKKCKEHFLKDMSRLKSFPTLPNKPDETSKSGRKRTIVLEYGQDSLKYVGQSTIARLSSVMCQCNDIDRHDIYIMQELV